MLKKHRPRPGRAPYQMREAGNNVFRLVKYLLYYVSKSFEIHGSALLSQNSKVHHVFLSLLLTTHLDVVV
jgi:hypothetical protein